MITTHEKELFQNRGVLRCPNFLSAATVAATQQAVWQQLRRMGLWRDEQWQLAGRQGVLVALLREHLALAAQINAEVQPVMSELIDGRPFFPMGDEVQLLFTPPNASQWRLPHANWHVDIPRLPGDQPPGLQFFTFADTVVGGGGGTLAVAGSHHFANEDRRINSAEVKKILQRQPYFRDLLSAKVEDRQRFLREPVQVGEAELQVVEMAGQPGDVYFIDIRVLHTVAPNAAATPRLMLTQRFLLESLRAVL